MNVPAQLRNMPVVSVVLTDDLRDRIAIEAQATGLKKSEIIRKALVNYFKRPAAKAKK